MPLPPCAGGRTASATWGGDPCGLGSAPAHGARSADNDRQERTVDPRTVARTRTPSRSDFPLTASSGHGVSDRAAPQGISAAVNRTRGIEAVAGSRIRSAAALIGPPGTRAPVDGSSAGTVSATLAKSARVSRKRGQDAVTRILGLRRSIGSGRNLSGSVLPSPLGRRR